MKPPTKKLHKPERHPLKVRGELHAMLSHRGRRCTQPVFMVKHFQHNQLGLPTIQALQVHFQVQAVSMPIAPQYLGLFTGLDTLKGSSYEIPCNIPLPLQKKVKDELVRDEGCYLTSQGATCWHGCCPQEVVIHGGHQGIQRCCLCISTSVWWPGISRQIEQLINNCPECAKTSVPNRQPMIGSLLPSHPWEMVASDLFELNGRVYLLVVDYFSRYMEVQTLTTITSVSIIRAPKAIFARHGIPSVLVSIKGPLYSSTEMQEFAERYNFQHITSSPHYPQSNGMAERAVKTAKSLLEKSADPHMALLSYRATPLPWCGLSPAEPFMGRRLQTDIPQPKRMFTPDWQYLASFREKDKNQKRQQKAEYDRHHRTRPLLPLIADETVWVRTQD